MVWFLELEMHWFYRLVSSTVGRQWRMVEMQVQCARVLGEGGTMILTSSWSSECGRRAKIWSGVSGCCRCPCGCRRRARRLRVTAGQGSMSAGFVASLRVERKRGGVRARTGRAGSVGVLWARAARPCTRWRAQVAWTPCVL